MPVERAWNWTVLVVGKDEGGGLTGVGGWSEYRPVVLSPWTCGNVVLSVIVRSWYAGVRLVDVWWRVGGGEEG